MLVFSCRTLCAYILAEEKIPGGLIYWFDTSPTPCCFTTFFRLIKQTVNMGEKIVQANPLEQFTLLGKRILAQISFSNLIWKISKFLSKNAKFTPIADVSLPFFATITSGVSISNYKSRVACCWCLTGANPRQHKIGQCSIKGLLNWPLKKREILLITRR